MLNVKQEKFIQNILNGMSQREAYKEAYGAKYKDNVIDNRACELLKKGEVQVRYNELLKKIEDKAIMSAEERRIWLSKIIKSGLEVNMSDKLKALNMLNKMDGEYTDRLKIFNDEEKTFEVNINVV